MNVQKRILRFFRRQVKLSQTCTPKASNSCMAQPVSVYVKIEGAEKWWPRNHLRRMKDFDPCSHDTPLAATLFGEATSNFYNVEANPPNWGQLLAETPPDPPPHSRLPPYSKAYPGATGTRNTTWALDVCLLYPSYAWRLISKAGWTRDVCENKMQKKQTRSRRPKPVNDRNPVLHLSSHLRFVQTKHSSGIQTASIPPSARYIPFSHSPNPMLGGNVLR